MGEALTQQAQIACGRSQVYALLACLFRKEIDEGLLDAASRSGFRLPEVMAGVGADEVATPVPYPHSCSPQAWAAAAPLLLLTTLG